ncbi:MAG TPA: ABC transporter ATP-binding protein [Solirubrobacteraceae bacterium]|nr:ABC transporter ATP-binding protein [Solirubrobacteraceae bacterium]
MPRIPRRNREEDPAPASGEAAVTPEADSGPGPEGEPVPAPTPPPATGGGTQDWTAPGESEPFAAPVAHSPEPAEAAHAPEPAEDRPAAEEPDHSRVSVVREHAGDEEDEEEEYQWHTGTKRPTGVPDAIEFVDVHKAFGRNKILRGLNMGLPEGKISMILGPSGTGKSVCIKHMVGLLYPDEGDVIVHGESVPSMVDDDLFAMRKKFGVLFQDGALFGSMNLYDNVAFPLRQHTDKGEDEIGDIVNRRLREVGLEGATDKMPNELSGGMRKRAGFARALVLDPDIVLFDEPDSGLDPVRTALLCELIQEIHEENGGAYVVITHDIMSARRVAEHISVLWKGRIVESGPAQELFNSDNAFVRQFLSGESQGPLGME